MADIGHLDIPPVGVTHAWLFSEGSGTVVRDEIGGTKNIDLSIASNYAWTPQGIRTTDGRIETPSIPNFRVVALAYKVKYSPAYAGAGFLICTDSGNVGITQVACSNFADVYQTQGESAHQVMRRMPPDIGTQAYSLSSGGYLIVWLDYGVVKSNPLWFGGRGGAGVTTSRVDEMDIAAAMTFNDTVQNMVASGLMRQVEDYLCGVLKRREVYPRNRDCPVMDSGVMLMGESSMSGRGVLTDLTVAERTETFPYTTIRSSNGSAVTAIAPGVLTIGVNQMAPDLTFNATKNFAFELGIASAYQAIPNRVGNLAISKTALGGTKNAVVNANGVNDPGPASSWDSSTLPFTTGLMALAVREWFYFTSVRRLAGVGVPMFWIVCELMENDGQNTNYVGGAANYQALRTRLKAFFLTWTGTPAAQIDWTDFRCPATYLGANPTAVTDIRTAQAAWAAVDLDVDLVDTDAYPMQPDGIHWTSRPLYDGGKAIVSLAPKLVATKTMFLVPVANLTLTAPVASLGLNVPAAASLNLAAPAVSMGLNVPAKSLALAAPMPSYQVDQFLPVPSPALTLAAHPPYRGGPLWTPVPPET